MTSITTASVLVSFGRCVAERGFYSFYVGEINLIQKLGGLSWQTINEQDESIRR